VGEGEGKGGKRSYDVSRFFETQFPASRDYAYIPAKPRHRKLGAEGRQEEGEGERAYLIQLYAELKPKLDNAFPRAMFTAKGKKKKKTDGEPESSRPAIETVKSVRTHSHAHSAVSVRISAREEEGRKERRKSCFDLAP